MLKKIYSMRWALRSILFSIYFNFHYLPFRQAIHLPILLRKPRFIKLKGSVVINGPIKTGMIRLGQWYVSIYHDNGFNWENHGGTVEFNGSCTLGAGGAISVGNDAKLSFGNDFLNAANIKIVCYSKILFGNHIRTGWNVLIMDTNFHPLYDMEKKKYTRVGGPIVTGDYVWLSTNCILMNSVNIPDRAIFALGSVITHSSPMKSYCLMGGNPVRILKENIMRDFSISHQEI